MYPNRDEDSQENEQFEQVSMSNKIENIEGQIDMIWPICIFGLLIWTLYYVEKLVIALWLKFMAVCLWKTPIQYALLGK